MRGAREQGLRITIGCPGDLGKDWCGLFSHTSGLGPDSDGRLLGVEENRSGARTTPMLHRSDVKTTSQSPATILEHFAALPDPRREHGKRHDLGEIVFIAICAVLCGADTWQEIADYATSKVDWLKTFLTLPGGVPSHDTFRRVFCLLDPMAFQACFFRWMTALMERHGLVPIALKDCKLRPIAIDGKCQRGSARRTVGQSPLHLVSAWSVANHLTLGQVATDVKSNEITAIPELLKLLDLEGAVVTIDAMGCQKEIARQIVDQKGEYVLAAKDNQPHLVEDIEQAFDEVLEHGEPGVDFTEYQTVETGHGRQETRTCCVITNPSGIRDAGLWSKLTAIVMVISERVVQGEVSLEARYYIGSMAATAEDYLQWIRGHWGIENSLHWVLDVCFQEDDQRHWAGNSAQNLAWLRKLALCLLKAEKTSKATSINRRRHLAGWKDEYLLKVLAQIPEKSDA
jgi:predicted transposase YbfD/YdcC